MEDFRNGKVNHDSIKNDGPDVALPGQNSFGGAAALKNKTLLFVALSLASPIWAQTASNPRNKPAAAHKHGATAMRTVQPQLPPGIPPAQAPIKTEFALRYQDLVVGAGAEAQPGQIYLVHYTGWLESDGTKFDSSVDRDQPIEFTQGMHQVIQGWDEGFEGMRVGGKRRLFVPYQLGYGAFGFRDIPPKANLIFDVELLDVRGMPMPGPRPYGPSGIEPAQPPVPPQPPSPPDPAQPQ